MAIRKNKNKWQTFCKEYLIDLNSTKAYIRAGYSPNGADGAAAKLMSDPDVKKYLDELMEKRGERTKITADRVIQEIERLATYDPKDLADITELSQIKGLPEDVRRAIVSWSWDRSGNFTLKLVKEKALEMLGRHHKLFTDTVEIHDKTALGERLNKAKKRVKK